MIDNIIEAINNVKQFAEEQGFDEKIHQSRQKIAELKKKISEEEGKISNYRLQQESFEDENIQGWVKLQESVSKRLSEHKEKKPTLIEPILDSWYLLEKTSNKYKVIRSVSNRGTLSSNEKSFKQWKYKYIGNSKFSKRNYPSLEESGSWPDTIDKRDILVPPSGFPEDVFSTSGGSIGISEVESLQRQNQLYDTFPEMSVEAKELNRKYDSVSSGVVQPSKKHRSH